ncbi:MAG: Type secretion system protein [Gemmatimonadetes bacterium]|jgi:type II secretory ATPase GspE/PulE/Tfp pilus assembly ATPase PilB-like protein/ActR/RegA family two-component response regulator|nr:Type secretion system protein [Gemmatimonadota bacterium]
MHWLVNAATRAGLAGTKNVTVNQGTPLGKAWELVARDLRMEPDTLAAKIAPVLRMKFADLDFVEVKARRLLPEKVARRYNVHALRETDRELFVASSDPNNYDAEQDIAFASGRRVVFELASPTAITRALSGAYSTDGLVESLLHNADATLADAVRVLEEDAPEEVTEQEVDSAPLVKLTNLILSDAVQQSASDIHIEPGGAKGGAVRFRVDGVMRQHMALPMAAVNRIVSRIKVLGKLDIADRMRPQDGRARIQIANKSYDLRISTVPTRDAEKAVIRILRPDSAKSLDEVGLAGPELQRFRQLIGYRDGIVIVTGPTGSGKTTTMYAAIADVADGQVNVMTVEDPIEYELPGITQIQVETRRNVTFASALRSILRQDPDVIFVGEIRDQETAQVAAHAAATGHLVLATLHTNDAMSSVSRLVDLGLDRTTVTAVLRGSLAQRLVRKLCTECKEFIFSGYTEDEERLATQFGLYPTMRPAGCASCNNTGYRGRLPITEVAIVTPSMGEQIAAGATAPQLQRMAVAQGMRPMREVALERVRMQETTLEEVERVLGEVAEEAAAVSASAPPVILLIDDDEMLRHLASSILETGGYRVIATPDGETALHILEGGEDVALVVTDLRMPGMDGEAVLKALRGRVGTVLMPVIVLTGSDEHDTEVRLMDAGADDYIRKPIDPPRFLSRIKAALRRAGVS